MGADAMISLQCSSSETIARDLNQFLHSKGVTTWICVEMQGGTNYREEIVINAAGSKSLIALMNTKWAESKECRYEFNIALRTNLTKGFPAIIPIIVENFDWNAYPLLIGVMANTNAIFYNAKDPKATWEQVVSALASFGISPSASSGAATASEEQKQVVPSSPDVKTSSDLPANITEWNCKHVSQWLRSLDLQTAADAFLNNWVDGVILLEIRTADLVDSLKFTPLQAKRVMREINAMIDIHSMKNVSQTERTKQGIVQQEKANERANIDLRSNKGFRTGLWEGFYQYPISSGGKKDPTSMDVTMVAGVVAGYGSDLVGDFLIQGFYDDTSLSISWDKTYIGRHTILYEGKMDKQTIKGSWSFKNSAGSGGPFELTLKKPHA